MGKSVIKEVFSKRLRDLMNDNNETTYSIGEYLHLSAATISRYITADMSPKITAIESLSIKYGVNPAWLMGYDVEKYLKSKPVFKEIPILGFIAAGQPLLVEENILGYEQINDNEKLDFCLKIKGDSMIGARIFDGDIVYIRQQEDVENGEIAAVIVDGETATLKRVYKEPGRIRLHPENPTMTDLVFTAKDRKQVKIIGRVLCVKFEAK